MQPHDGVIVDSEWLAWSDLRVGLIPGTFAERSIAERLPVIHRKSKYSQRNVETTHQSRSRRAGGSSARGGHLGGSQSACENRLLSQLSGVCPEPVLAK